MAVVLKACCDETGTHSGAPITCMGGYVFDEEGERNFTTEWIDVLGPFKEHGIKLFHANKCYHLKGDFQNITEAEKKLLFDALISLTRRTARFGMASWIKDEVFERGVKRNKFQSFTGSKYTVCALRSLNLIEQWANENNFDGKVIYLFESGNEYQGRSRCDDAKGQGESPTAGGFSLRGSRIY